MELNVVDSKMTVSVSDAVFGAKFNQPLIHQVVTAYLAKRRSGNSAQKTRSEVRGGGIKPWRQKGTGRARAGTIRSPLWRGGGVTFAAQPTSYAQKINKKMAQGAFRSVLSELIRQDRLVVVESFSIESPKTKLLVATLSALDSGFDRVLIVVEKEDRNLELASRNLFKVVVQESQNVDIVDLIKFDDILMTTAAMRSIEARLA
jgi:large subunit ribosomal protein L4